MLIDLLVAKGAKVNVYASYFVTLVPIVGISYKAVIHELVVGDLGDPVRVNGTNVLKLKHA